MLTQLSLIQNYLGYTATPIGGTRSQDHKVWDITRNTYRQTYCLDVGSDSFTAMSGHMDGGLRFWVMRAGDRTADISKLHEGGITSVQFHPTNAMQVLTNGTCFCVYADTFALSGSRKSGEIFVWRVADGQLEKKLSAH